MHERPPTDAAAGQADVPGSDPPAPQQPTREQLLRLGFRERAPSGRTTTFVGSGSGEAIHALWKAWKQRQAAEPKAAEADASDTNPRTKSE
jgi:hypothetical protein